MSNTCNPKWRGGNIDSLFRWRLEGGGFVFSFLVVYQYYPNFFYNEDIEKVFLLYVFVNAFLNYLFR